MSSSLKSQLAIIKQLQYKSGQLGPQQTFNLNPDEYPAREIQYSTIEFWPSNNS